MTGASGYDALMDRVCVGLGLCGCIKNGRRLHVRDLLPPTGPVTADQFAEWVLLADNMNPNLERWLGLKQKVKAAFVEYMGGEVVDASLLKWTDR